MRFVVDGSVTQCTVKLSAGFLALRTPGCADLIHLETISVHIVA